MIRLYKCKYCNKESGRKEIRKCVMTHIKTDKKNRKEVKESRKNSNITRATL